MEFKIENGIIRTSKGINNAKGSSTCDDFDERDLCISLEGRMDLLDLQIETDSQLEALNITLYGKQVEELYEALKALKGD